MRDLFTAGLFHLDSPTLARSRESFVAKKFAISPEGQGNSWVDFWQQGQQQNPQTRFAMLTHQAGLAGFAQASHDAEEASLPLGIDDPTNGLYGLCAPTQCTEERDRGHRLQRRCARHRASRRPMSDYDQLVRDWKTAAGDQVRKELTSAMTS